MEVFKNNMNKIKVGIIGAGIVSEGHLASLEDGLEVMRVIDACYESARTGKRVSVN